MSEKQITPEWKHPNLPPRPFTFPNIPSHLDESNPQSSLNRSELRGFYNLVAIFGFIFLITQPVINFIDYGYFLEPTLFQTFKVDFIFCLVSWPLFFLWYYLPNSGLLRPIFCKF